MTEITQAPATKKLEVSNSNDETCMTYCMNGEDHTLGNALRYMIMKNPEVKFCGYAIPHPSENKINLRIQTVREPALNVLQDGLESLHDTCLHILDTFKVAVIKYNKLDKSNIGEEMDT